MPGEHLSLSKSSLAYAKLAATPTNTAWSQIYNAGNLFACLSLTRSADDENPASLQNLGKELFNTLEAEFFTLEEKNLTTIADAITKSIKHIPPEIVTNLCLVFFKEHILYLFLFGHGRVVMKRKETLGVLIENKEETNDKLQTASGYLHNEDTIILETKQFAKNVSDKHLAEALQLNLPNDIAETLSLHMHKNADGDQAAIIIVYHGVTKSPFAPIKEPSLPDKQEAQEMLQTSMPQKKKEPAIPLTTRLATLIPKIHLTFLTQNRHVNMRLNHRKKIFLSITLIILCLLVASIVLTKQKQLSDKTTALFHTVYDSAFTNYDNGKSLKSLNADVSHEDFLKAEKLLKDNKDKFPKDSSQAKQIANLLTKVQAELGPTSAIGNTTPSKEAHVSDTDLLTIEKKTPDGSGFSQNDTSIYYATDKAIVSVDKTTGKTKDMIKNDNDWKKALAVVPYQDNLYVLDPDNGIIKYVSSGNGFSKSTYLKTPQDLNKAVSMAIDSSVWVLFTEGKITKFTRGQPDSFSIKGLDKPFNNPTKIYTDKDITNVYILDAGNSRIVQLTNDGTFEKQYISLTIQKAKDFEVLEKEKKILLLSGGKIWEMDL